MSDINQRLARLSPEKRELLEQWLLKKNNSKDDFAIPKCELNDFYPLSDAQMRFWLLQELNPDNSALNLSIGIKITGLINQSALKCCLNEIVRRHESLRTVFKIVEGKPVQVILPHYNLPLKNIDLSALPEIEREPEVRTLTSEECKLPFLLFDEPPIRVFLIQYCEGNYLLQLILHHMIFDGSSTEVLFRELCSLYQTFLSGKVSLLPELPIQYRDYACWQQERSNGQEYTRQLDYWKTKLKDSNQLLELPTDYQRPSVQTFRGGQVILSLNEVLTGKLKALSCQEGATLYMLLLAAFQILISRYTSQEDFQVGSPVNGRNRTELGQLIGVFINSLALRADLTGNPTFRSLLKRVQTVTLEAFDHQDVPFEKVLEQLHPERRLSHMPLFQILFNMLNFSVSEFELPDLETEISTLPSDVGSNFDMTLYCFEQENVLNFSLVYNADLFKTDRMTNFLNQYIYLLEQIVLKPDLNISDFSLATKELKDILPDPTENIPIDNFPSVSSLFMKCAGDSPNQIGVCQNDRNWSYSKLQESIFNLIRILHESNIGKGKVIAVIGPRGYEFVVSMLAVIANGDILLTLDRKLPVARQELMFNEANCEQVIYIGEKRSEDFWLWKSTNVIIYKDDSSIVSDSDLILPEINPDDPAYIFFTSGTTGVPKGILGGHRGLSHFLLWQKDQFSIGPGDRSAQLTGLSFDVLLRDVFLPLISGATLCIPNDPDDLSSDYVLPWLEHERITLLHTVPTLAKTWIAHKTEGVTLGSLRLVFFAGEPLDSLLIVRWRSAFGDKGKIVNLYGPTETTLAKCFYLIPEVINFGVQPIGWPLPATQILIISNQNRLCGVNEQGEIVIRTPYRSLGYINLSLSDQIRFKQNPFNPSQGDDILYFTGDRGRYRSDGAIEILGRLDNQVKIHGIRVEPDEINAILSQNPDVVESVVVARNSSLTNSLVLVAYVVVKNNLNSRQLYHYLLDRLPEYMVPKSIFLLDTFPVTANGKVDRKALPFPDEKEAPSADSTAAPRTPFEDTMLEIWKEVLKSKQIGIYDNFFEAGGHSLLATQVISRARQIFQVDIPIRTLFEHPTISDLSAQIELALRQEKSVLAPSIRPYPRLHQIPLSFSQERMWFIHQLDPNSSAYHVLASIRLKGRVDISALEDCFHQIAQRHEILRTTFDIVEGQLFQVIAPEPNIYLEIVNLKNNSAGEIDFQFSNLIQQESKKPFNLREGPLFRASLYCFDEDRFVLLIVVHHIISDAWSTGNIFKEIEALYNSKVTGCQIRLPELPIQYADFALWQREWMQGDIIARQLSYWRNKLACINVLNLPTDRLRPAVQTSNGAIFTLKVSESFINSLRVIGHKYNATLFMTLLAAFKVLLYRYTGQTDLAIGVPISNRQKIELEGLIGTFVNTLVFRSDLSGNPTFIEVLQRVRDVALEAFTHRDISFAKLVEELQPERDMSHSPFFQVMFNVINVPSQAINLSNLDSEILVVDRKGAQFDLTCTVIDLPGFQQIQFNFNTDIFSADSIDRLANHYFTLLNSLITKPDQVISEIPILTQQEMKQLVEDWNYTEQEYSQNKGVHHLFEEQVLRTPDSIAVVGDSIIKNSESKLTYFELDRKSNQLANYLRKLGVNSNVRVGISLKRGIEMLVGLLGILKAGGTYIPFDPAFPKNRLQQMIQDAQADVLITQKVITFQLPDLSMIRSVVCLDQVWELIEKENGTPPILIDDPSNLAYILFTSGSTGRPKGVEIPHRALTNLLLSMQSEPGINQHDILLAITTLSFDIAGLELYLPLICGAKVVIANQETVLDGSLLLAKLIESKATIMQATPATWRMLIDAGWKKTPGLKMLCGGEALPRDLANQMLGHGNSLWNMYGPTETTIWSSTCEIRPGDDDIKLGYPIANTQFYVLDGNLQLAPVGIPGELFIGGDGVAQGYFNQAGLTKERFLPNPFISGGRMYRTGDLVKRNSCGDVEFLGRADFQVKVRGFRIELGDVETAVLENKRIRQTVVIVREDNSRETQLVCFFVPEGAPSPTPSELRDHLKDKIPYYMVPSLFIEIGRLPLTPNGKIDRKSLKIPDNFELLQANKNDSPLTETERELSEIWKSLLNIKQVGRQDDFFLLGGHSLLGVRLFAKIEEKFATKLPLATLFQSSTLELLARTIDQQSCSLEPLQNMHPLVVIQPKGNKPPFFCVHPIGGGVMGYYPLSHHLGEDQPFYGLEAIPEDIDASFMDRIESMAEKYIAAIQKVQPKGPYYIGGYSYGGTVAYEMAQQLLAIGQRVNLLAMLDNPAPKSGYQKAHLNLKFITGFVGNLSHWWNDFWQTSSKERVGRIRRKLLKRKKTALNNGEIDLSSLVDDISPIPLDYQKLMERQFRAFNLYQPCPYNGRVSLFRTPRQPLICSYDPFLEWNKLARGGIDLYKIKGAHRNILQEPFVKELAEELKIALEETQQKSE